MKKIRKRVYGIILLICAVAMISGFSHTVAMAELKEIQLSAWTIGPEAASITRKTNLDAAAERLNRMLSDTDTLIRVKLDASFSSANWPDYARRLIFAFKGEEAPDIILHHYNRIPLLVEAEYLLPLDEFLAKYPEVYNDIAPHLWNAVKWKGKIYGIPQDTNARMCYFRKDVLRKLGWNENRIASLQSKVERGEFTLTDLAQVAKDAKDKGIVEWGIYHRPKVGGDHFETVKSFGGTFQDNVTGKLVLDKSAMLEALQYAYDLVYKYKVTPAGMTTLEWKSVHTAFTEGDILFWLHGGVWNKAEWFTQYGLTEEEFAENVGFFPIPAGKKGEAPNQAFSPTAYIINAKSKYPKVAFLLMTLATSPDLDAKHALDSAHLPVRFSALGIPDFAANEFMRRVATELGRYAWVQPAHPSWSKYSRIYFEVLGGVEFGKLTPEDGLNFMVDRMEREIGEELIITE